MNQCYIVNLFPANMMSENNLICLKLGKQPIYTFATEYFNKFVVVLTCLMFIIDTHPVHLLLKNIYKI